MLQELTGKEGSAQDEADGSEKIHSETPDMELTEDGIRYAIHEIPRSAPSRRSPAFRRRSNRAYQELISKSDPYLTKARKENDFASFALVLKEIIDYQKKFASYRQKEGQKLYDVMLDSFEPGFTMKKLDEFF